MPKRANETAVEYLIRLRYPDAKAINFPIALSSSKSVSEMHVWRMLQEQLAAYTAELQKKTPQEIAELVAAGEAREDAENARKFQQATEKREREERERPFNQPYAMAAAATYEFASKRYDWRLDEAVAYSLGKNPTVVNWETVRPHVSVSVFAARYAQLREITLGAVRWKQLFDPVAPGAYLAWAKRHRVDVPAELIEQVKAHGVVIADWQDLYEQEQKRAERSQALADALKVELTNAIAESAVQSTVAQDLRGELEQSCSAVESLRAELEARKGRWPWGENYSTEQLELLAKVVTALCVGNSDGAPNDSVPDKDILRFLTDQDEPQGGPNSRDITVRNIGWMIRKRKK